MKLKRKDGENLLHALNLQQDKTYECIQASNKAYIGHILIAKSYDDLYGVWLTSPGILSDLTMDIDSFKFKEINVKLVEE